MLSHFIRPMTHADLDFAIACTVAEGWYGQTRSGFEDFLAYNPQGCFVGEMSGELAGICIATAYQRHGFIGTLVVRPEFRGHGLGTRLFLSAIRYLSDRGMESMSLEGDPPGLPIYMKAGFRKICHSLRFNGSIPGKEYPCIFPISPSDLDEICILDTELFGDDRSFFLRQKYERQPELCFLSRLNGMVNGYLMASYGESIISVGPWAIKPETAPTLALLERLALVAPNLPYRIGVLETNKPAVSRLRAIPSLRESEPSWRMVLGEGDGPGLSKWLYAIGSPAKG